MSSQVLDTGTVIVVTITESDVAKDISSATTKQFLLKCPDKTVLTRTASFTTTGTDGKLQYATIAADFAQSGVYSIQVYLVMPTWTGHSEVGTIEVLKNLN